MKKLLLFLSVSALILAVPALAAKPQPPTKPAHVGVIGTADSIQVIGGDFYPNDTVTVSIQLVDGLIGFTKTRSDKDGVIFAEYGMSCADIASVTATDQHGGTASAVPVC